VANTSSTGQEERQVRRREQVRAGRELLRAERADLVALLRDLEPDDWRKPTPCMGWTVTDVAAHVLAWERMLAGPSIIGRVVGSGRLLGLVITSRLDVDRLNAYLRARSHTDPDRILAGFGRPAVEGWRWRFDRLSPGAQLAEYVVHHEDIRHAVGRPRDIPPERLQVAIAGVERVPGMRSRRDQRRPSGLSGRSLLLHLAGRRPPVV
jgi:uncharacterized protein (TIGR03083 family)